MAQTEKTFEQSQTFKAVEMARALAHVAREWDDGGKPEVAAKFRECAQLPMESLARLYDAIKGA